MYEAMNSFELEIIKAIGKHNPPILSVLGELQVSSRELTGAGCYINFTKIEKPIETNTQILDLFGTIDLPDATQLSAHIEMECGIPVTLEICCLSQKGWNGEYEGFKIEN